MNLKNLLTKLNNIESKTQLNECESMAIPSSPMQQDSVSINVSMNGTGKGGVGDILDVLRKLDTLSTKPDLGPDMLKSPVAFNGKDDMADNDRGEGWVGSGVGGVAGGKVGTAVGGALGTAVGGPVGGAVGSVAGKVAGTAVGSKVGDEITGEEFANEPDEMYAGVDAVTQSGDDLHANNGDHRMRQAGLPVAKPNMENLKSRLESLYDEIREASAAMRNSSNNEQGISEISGALADKVATARRKQADDARDKDPNSPETKAKKRKADDAQWNWIKRMSRDNYRGKSQAEINKGYADDADANTKRGWSND
jgi:hypothetical protein